MKKISALFIVLLMNFVTFSAQAKFDKDKKEIAAMLDQFNIAAAHAEYDQYFSFFADESTFIGTDATEVWNKKEFMAWAKPHFDKKQTWNFTSLKRNIHFTADGKLAWFDELLSTQMKLCRGSGVVEKINGVWKIRQYVLSMTIPNEVVDPVVETKTVLEDALIEKLNSKK